MNASTPRSVRSVSNPPQRASLRLDVDALARGANERVIPPRFQTVPTSTNSTYANDTRDLTRSWIDDQRLWRSDNPKPPENACPHVSCGSSRSHLCDPPINESGIPPRFRAVPSSTDPIYVQNNEHVDKTKTCVEDPRSSEPDDPKPLEIIYTFGPCGLSGCHLRNTSKTPEIDKEVRKTEDVDPIPPWVQEASNSDNMNSSKSLSMKQIPPREFYELPNKPVEQAPPTHPQRGPSSTWSIPEAYQYYQSGVVPDQSNHFDIYSEVIFESSFARGWR